MLFIIEGLHTLMAKSKEDWFKEALHVLAENGFTQLKIEVLTTRLAVTKGSFYHHFQNYEDFKTKLLNYLEQFATSEIIQRAEENAITPQQKLRRLFEIGTSYPSAFEVNIRAWALYDSAVSTYQAKVDAQRIAYMKSLGELLLDDPGKAQLMAESFYALLIGGEHMQPALNSQQRLYLLINLATLYGINLETVSAENQ
jgi:AcrR family transcriptional regulator